MPLTAVRAGVVLLTLATISLLVLFGSEIAVMLLAMCGAMGVATMLFAGSAPEPMRVPVRVRRSRFDR